VREHLVVLEAVEAGDKDLAGEAMIVSMISERVNLESSVASHFDDPGAAIEKRASR
jgi:DNA-binding GntR family transcriptional regulator